MTRQAGRSRARTALQFIQYATLLICCLVICGRAASALAALRFGLPRNQLFSSVARVWRVGRSHTARAIGSAFRVQHRFASSVRRLSTTQPHISDAFADMNCMLCYTKSHVAPLITHELPIVKCNRISVAPMRYDVSFSQFVSRDARSSALVCSVLFQPSVRRRERRRRARMRTQAHHTHDGLPSVDGTNHRRVRHEC